MGGDSGQIIPRSSRIEIVKPLAQEKQAITRLFERHQKIIFARFVAGLLGTAGLIEFVARSHYDPFCYFFAFAIILIAELLDRYVFYAAREVSRL